MPHSAHSAKVNAPLSVVWEQLISKVYHPDRFLIGVNGVEILEDDAANRRVIRKMALNAGGKEMVIVEEIVWDEATHVVDFRILEHPSHTGNVINKIEKDENGDLILTYEMRWDFKGEGDDPMGGMVINKAVENSIKVIEEAAKKSGRS